ncbi:MAG: sigma-70 family RNA polymerase sigma factor [Bryobacterales bacterium]|nr:sigma-70 family RNA polymerase sigma factor [Bryobacterales bacterium]
MDKGLVTELLKEWGQGDRAAFDQLLPVVYRELHKIAKRCLSQHEQQDVLQTTAVINEAYLRLSSGVEQTLENRGHFFNVAAKAMRNVLVDHARSRNAEKRGGGIRIEAIDDGLQIASAVSADVVALSEALDVLAASHPRPAQVVELRYFAGLNVEETANALSVSTQTVIRDWRFAKSFLRREMERGAPSA